MNRIKTIVIVITSFLAIQGYAQYSPCGGGNDKLPTDSIPKSPDKHPSDSTDVPVYEPQDPNEIIGTKGYDALGDTLQWVAATASLPYTIYFENDPELATAAAQKVEVRLALHPKMDISTFAVGAFGFGSHVFTVEGTRSAYQQRLDLTQEMGLYVDVVAGIDIVSNEAFWIFQSIDPATGLPPQGTQEGFLPVNDESHSGEGYVSFTIKPKATVCATGDVVTATASIVFDINEAIPTNMWHNTVDALPPTTQLTGTDNGNNEVLLQFSGQDDEGGCGIKQYKLYVSDNYGAYSLYDTYPVGSEATYPTEYDHCYRFFCLGEDNVGNVEEMKAEAEFEYGNYNLVVTATASPEEGGTVSGGGAYVYGSTATLTATPNPGYAFVNWTNQGVTVSTEPSYSFSVTENCQLVARFVEAIITQTTQLTQGWNWWSCYIELDGANGFQSLQEGLGTSGMMIKSQNDGYASYLEGFGWYGSLTTINNENTYQIRTSTPCTVELAGSAANPDEHPITLNMGWKWVGYPATVDMGVGEAFSGIAPLSGDMLKSQNNGYASYLEGFGWYGSLNTLNPGMGLMYKSNNGNPVTLVYPTGGTRTDLMANQTTDGNYWEPNLNAYPDNMSVMAIIEVDGEELASENFELAAFANGEVRGSARLLYVEPLNRYMAFLTVAGDEATELRFALYNTETGDVETQSFASLQYETDAVVGSFAEPYVVSFRSITGLEEWANSVSLFPNPVERGETVTLGLPEVETLRATSVETIDALGMVVETHGHASLQRITAPKVAGVYTLRITVEGKGTCYRKLVVR